MLPRSQTHERLGNPVVMTMTLTSDSPALNPSSETLGKSLDFSKTPVPRLQNEHSNGTGEERRHGKSSEQHLAYTGRSINVSCY